MQCAIALLSDAQTEGKVSATPKYWLPRNNIKPYCKTFAASAELAYGQPSQEAPKNSLYVTNHQLMENFYVHSCLFSGILIEKWFF